MKTVLFAVITLLSAEAKSYVLSDTLFYDTATGNYIIQYQSEDGSTQVVSYNPPTKIFPRITCEVTNSTSESSFYYQYVVENLATSKQSLRVFMVSFGEVAETRGGSSGNWMSKRKMEMKNGKLRQSSLWMWTDRSGLRPSSVQDGFVLISSGLPGINNAYCQGGTNTLAYPDKGPNIDIKKQLVYMNTFPRNVVAAPTISPTSPPESAEIFLDTLISYKHQALALKWIDNEGIANSLDQKLENAKAKLVSGDSVAARNILEAFVSEVEAQKDKHLTSEAYALLKFNAEYLINRLPGGGRRN